MSPISPVGTGPGPVGLPPEGLVPGPPEGIVPGPPVGLSVGLGPRDVSMMGPKLGPKVGPEVELLRHLQNFFLGKHFSAGLSGGGAGENTGGSVFAGSWVISLPSP
jgi:hypothetical protein